MPVTNTPPGCDDRPDDLSQQISSSSLCRTYSVCPEETLTAVTDPLVHAGGIVGSGVNGSGSGTIGCGTYGSGCGMIGSGERGWGSGKIGVGGSPGIGGWNGGGTSGSGCGAGCGGCGTFMQFHYPIAAFEKRHTAQNPHRPERHTARYRRTPPA